MNIPDAAVEAAARAMDANFNPDYYPILSAMFSDYAATALTAAAPHIAAQALKDAADVLQNAYPAATRRLREIEARHRNEARNG